MNYIEQLEIQLKQLIKRALKENIDEWIIYEDIVNYLNNIHWDDDICNDIINIIINILRKYDYECMVKIIDENKDKFIKRLMKLEHKRILASPLETLLYFKSEMRDKMISISPKNYTKLTNEIYNVFYFFNHVKIYIKKLKYG